MELYSVESPLVVLEIEIDKEALSAVRFSNKPFKTKIILLKLQTLLSKSWKNTLLIKRFFRNSN